MGNENRCVMCGEIIPEGLQVCYKCIMDVETSTSLLERKDNELTKQKKIFKKRKNKRKTV